MPACLYCPCLIVLDEYVGGHNDDIQTVFCCAYESATSLTALGTSLTTTPEQCPLRNEGKEPVVKSFTKVLTELGLVTAVSNEVETEPFGYRKTWQKCTDSLVMYRLLEKLRVLADYPMWYLQGLTRLESEHEEIAAWAAQSLHFAQSLKNESPVEAVQFTQQVLAIREKFYLRSDTTLANTIREKVRWSSVAHKLGQYLKSFPN